MGAFEIREDFYLNDQPLRFYLVQFIIFGSIVRIGIIPYIT